VNCPATDKKDRDVLPRDFGRWIVVVFGYNHLPCLGYVLVLEIESGRSIDPGAHR
jgi:hypothetical protein